MITLNKSNVVFDEVAHTYILGDKQLQGITGLLGRQLFPDEYGGVSEKVLAQKAEFGHNIHGQIELYDNGINPDTEYTAAYQRIKEQHSLSTVDNEYLVSDNENFASSIDIVMVNADNEVWLVDTKTVYTLNRSKVAWQLSIYKAFFEAQNPHLKVKGIACLWFKIRKKVLEDTLFIDLTPLLKPEEAVRELLRCEVAGEQFVDTTSTELVVTNDMVESICRLETAVKELTEKRDELRQELLKLMQDGGVKSFKNDSIMLTRKLASTTKRFDAKAFEKDHPDLYAQYVKESATKESIVIKIYGDKD